MAYQIFKIRKVLKKKGFTLIELLVVIAIIGILAAFAYASFSGVQARGRDAKRKNDLDQIKKAMQMYYNDNNAYPITTGTDWYSYCNYWNANKDVTGATGYIPNLAPTYIKVLPLDPKRGTDKTAMAHPASGATALVQNYCYIYKSNGTDYKVAAYCGIEGQAINTSDFWYKGNLSWGCDNYPSANFSNSYAIWTQGAQSW